MAVCVTSALLALCGCGSGGAAVVAQVGGEAITSSDLDHWVAVEKDLLGGLPVQKSVVLGYLIGFHWVLAEAKEYGLRVSSAEADKELALLQYARRSKTPSDLFSAQEEEQLFSDDGDLQHLLASPKLSAADRVWLVSLLTLLPRILTQLATAAEGHIGQNQVTSFYRDNGASFVVPEKRDIEIFMTVKQATAAKGKREILAGKSFQSVVKRLNIAPEAEHGLIMGLARNVGEEALLKHFFGARPHVLTGPVRQALFYVFRVAKVYPSRLPALSEVAASIKQKLAEREAANVLAPALRARWRARTSCRSGYVVAQCGKRSGAAGAS